MTNQQMERAFDWDDEIEKSGGDFVLLPEGEYNFTVEKFERGRYNGSANLPACNMAILTLKIDGGQHGTATVIDRLYLHSKTEGFLSNFFEAIGQKQEGQRVKMNWNAVHGAKGRCKLEINNYTNNEGQDRQNNQVKTYLPYKKYLENQGGGQAPPQQQQAQPNMNTAPFPGAGQPGAPYTSGNF